MKTLTLSGGRRVTADSRSYLVFDGYAITAYGMSAGHGSIVVEDGRAHHTGDQAPRRVSAATLADLDATDTETTDEDVEMTLYISEQSAPGEDPAAFIPSNPEMDGLGVKSPMYFADEEAGAVFAVDVTPNQYGRVTDGVLIEGGEHEPEEDGAIVRNIETGIADYRSWEAADELARSDAWTRVERIVS